MQVSRLKSAIFDKQQVITRKWYKIDAYFLLKSNGYVADDLGDPNLTKPPQFLHIALPFVSRYIVDERRDFKFGGQVDYINSQPTDDKPSVKEAGHVTRPVFTQTTPQAVIS